MDVVSRHMTMFRNSITDHLVRLGYIASEAGAHLCEHMAAPASFPQSGV